MNRAVVYLAAAVIIVGIGAGFLYYQHKQNTLLEVGVGSHSVSVQKN